MLDLTFDQNFVNMKIISSVIACAIISSTAFAQGLKVPAPSPATTIKQDFALSSVEISYSRPGAKGRKIFGDLVPFEKYGEQVPMPLP